MYSFQLSVYIVPPGAGDGEGICIDSRLRGNDKVRSGNDGGVRLPHPATVGLAMTNGIVNNKSYIK